MILFNRDGDGGREITEVLGMISDCVDFDVWAPILPLGIRDVTAIIGREPVAELAARYETAIYDADFEPAIKYLQQAVALFTWLKIIPTLDANHDSSGRQRRLGENEKGLTALEQYKDEENIRHLAYEATDALIEELDCRGFEFWIKSPKCRLREGLLIKNKETFDEYYHIGSHRLFLTLLPMIREVQASTVAPVLGDRHIDELLHEEGAAIEKLRDTASRAIALLTMKKAVERLPVEVLPEGIVQVNQSAPVKQRLKAEKEARNSVAMSLGADAARYLQQLEDAVAEIDANGEPVDFYNPGPIVHTKGMSF